MRTILALAFVVLAPAIAISADGGPIAIQKRSRVEQPDGKWIVQESTETWQPAQTAIIVCDMWDSHHCLNAVRRAVELAPRMNDVLTKARSQGVFIIHAPSSCMEAYQSHPGRAMAQSAPTAGNLPSDIGQWCSIIPAEEKGVYPIDQVAGGEDDNLKEHSIWHKKLAIVGRNPAAPWKAQLKPLEISNQDAISDSGIEIWNLLESRKINNVILLGVHTNMCVLGRPFGLRQLAKNGKNVVLMRDMTDTMYDPAKWPYVSHFAGTDLIVEHIEKFVCPTITSVALLGGEPFRFSHDKRKVVILIGDDEYKTEITLPAFVESDLKPLGFDVTVIHADQQDKNKFPGMAEAIRHADLVLVSARRRLPPPDQLDALRQHVAAGKPVVGIRTASHAWCLRTDQENMAAVAQGQGAWPEFDAEVLGGHYTGHHGVGAKTAISVADAAVEHPVLRGIEVGKLTGNGSLYKTEPLAQTAGRLLIGSIPGQQPEPVAWTNLAGTKQARVFYTSLGHPDDFENPVFRKLLVNGLFWALEIPYPIGQDIDRLLPAATK